MTSIQARTPWHLWLVGILSLLWNAFGAWDYTATQMENREYLAAAAQSMGVSVDAVIAHFAAYPAWMDAAWALGVWGSVLGSILLLLRKRLAVIAFFISLFGLFVSTLYGIATPIESMEQSAANWSMMAVIWIVLIGLILYARSMVKRGHLR
ncbi:MAG: hypothetical protein KDE32_11715 [Novosphingobium sp.]|nr:hypothetical protein [Novosphingobium sp.]